MRKTTTKYFHRPTMACRADQHQNCPGAVRDDGAKNEITGLCPCWCHR